MAIPKEAIACAFPAKCVIGALTIHPPTLLHLFALGACGNPMVVGETVPTIQQQVELVAVLSISPDQIEALFQFGVEKGVSGLVGLRDRITMRTKSSSLLSAITHALDMQAAAMANFVPTRDKDAGDELGANLIDNWGWPMVMAEFVMHEYGYDWDAAVRIPLARLFSCRALAEVMRAGRVPCVPSYGEKAYIDSLTDKPGTVSGDVGV